jgi:hypothetical protein
MVNINIFQRRRVTIKFIQTTFQLSECHLTVNQLNYVFIKIMLFLEPTYKIVTLFWGPSQYYDIILRLLLLYVKFI